MITVADDTSARGLAGWLETREKLRSGQKLSVVRPTVAFKARLSPGTLENLARDRLKRGVDLIRDRLLSIVISELEADLARAQHELAFLKASHRRVDQSQVAEVEQEISTLRQALNGEASDDA